jgi:hypothetical protein
MKRHPRDGLLSNSVKSEYFTKLIFHQVNIFKAKEGIVNFRINNMPLAAMLKPTTLPALKVTCPNTECGYVTTTVRVNSQFINCSKCHTAIKISFRDNKKAEER